MPSGPRKRRTLGRGMGDLVGNDLESLVRAAGQPPDAPAAPAGERPPDLPVPASAGATFGKEEAVPPDEPPAPPAAIERVPAEAKPEESPDDRAGTMRGDAPPPRAAKPSTRVQELPPGPNRRAAPSLPPPRETRPDAASPRVFAVASGKGGTGKSLIAVNLAVAMAERSRVCLIDADFGLGNAHILLGVMPRWNVAHLLRGEKTLEETLVAGPRGLRLLPGASGVPEMSSLADAVLDGLATTLDPILGSYDATVLDCPAGLSRQSLVMLYASDVVMVVTTDDLTAMTDAYALIKTLVTHRPGLTVGVVVNDAPSASEGAETYRRINHVSRKFLGRDLLSLGTIPSDVQLERSVMERRPAVLGHPRSASARAIEELALRLVSLQRREAAGFPERMHRTLAAAAAPQGRGGRQGEGLCMS